MKKIRQVATALFFIILNFTVFSQDVNFSTSTNGIKKVGISDRFEVTYTVNKKGQFYLPKYKNFKVIGNVSQGNSNSISQDFNTGKTVIKSSYTFGVVLQAKKLGVLTIEGAKIKIGNVTYESKPVKIEIVKESQARKRSQNDPFAELRQMQEDMMRRMQSRREQKPVEISDKDFFGRINISKSNPYVNEQVLATYKLYTRNFNWGLDKHNFPTQEGFWVENIEIPENAKAVDEVIDGVHYNVYTVRKEILFPQDAKKIKLNPFDLTVRIQTSPFSAPVSKTLKSNAPVIDVKALPKNAPESFVNQVGDREMKVEFQTDSVVVDQPIDFKITISGKGNLKQLSEMELQFPESFEEYDPETKNKLRVSENGVSGSKTYSYLLIPRKTGVFKIKPITFSYFDLKTKTYQTISSQEQTVKVYGEDGSIDETMVEEEVIVSETSKEVGGSDWTWLYILLPSLLLGGGALYYLIFKRQTKEETEEERRRNARKKLAMKMALAKAHLDDNNIGSFYDETLIGLNKYVNEKLQIQTANMTKENIEEVLSIKGVEQNTIKSFIHVLEQCEMAKYAPLSPQNNLEIYEKSVDVIEQIERVIK